LIHFKDFFGHFFLCIMSGSVLLHHQRSPEDLHQLLAWYKIRDTLFGENYVKQDIKKALELASACAHPNAVWLAKLFAGRDDATPEEARLVFLGCESDHRALCLAGWLGGPIDEILRAVDLGNAFAQAEISRLSVSEGRFRWAEKSAAQGERDGFYHFGYCYRDGFGCVTDVEKAKENFLVAADLLGHVYAMVCLCELLDTDDLQRLVWLGRAAANGKFSCFLTEMSDQMGNFGSGTGHSKVVFAIGRALKGHIGNEKRRIFGSDYNFDTCIGPANQALHFYKFQLQSYRKAVDS
jgi:TPR repeat protein